MGLVRRLLKVSAIQRTVNVSPEPFGGVERKSGCTLTFSHFLQTMV